MSERLRVEVLDEIFFPAPVRDAQGRIIPAPPAAQRKKIELSQTWLANHPMLPHDKPMVTMGPRSKDGVEGYSVRKKVIYKP